MAERRGIRVLVCGGREFNDAELLGSWLGGIHKQRRIACLIEGGAHGADYMAKRFAEWMNVPVESYPADWQRHGKSAGPIRNLEMLTKGRPDLVVAFAGGLGTADMMRQARQAGIPVLDTASQESVAHYQAARAAHDLEITRDG